ncbi:CxxH/CxxC protein [Clostridium manihotivorum]|uniref:CxxH/CxxC protein n=1 Tax=Clostridium manihotivorum TaxID=2320868 RepID=A0A410DMZ2_9CLOT|nr:CxxH/CxxC protein [Clostridium manihotivorum]QAA30453.1 CxxH/CxxC protein [Clostridium manihotivorum]
MSSYIEKLSCGDHVDMAIDEYIDEYETFPNLEGIDDGKCSYCELKAIYKISGSTSEE